ncbi:MAG TPA: hypothetical protein VE954_36795 [Oligoflexus sp.]|uniref:hypothetical protein n=1 Tax=Oligoflexus sp. TaxID=1971216 RepID=UPI002D4AA866|nr:hypothetical protein [Oligoflexus sp.]HYX38696.1 hypothetical protein [Oligoflexus sp.]
MQTLLIGVLNYHGMGADIAASGANRWMPNFRNPQKLLYANEARRRWVHNVRHFVISELYEAYRDHPAVVYIRKTERASQFLHPDFRMEKKLARLLIHIQGIIGFGGMINMSMRDICRISGMDQSSFYRSFLGRADKMRWLEIERLGGRRGYNLRCTPSIVLADRAAAIVEGRAHADEREVVSRPPSSGETSCLPDDVPDGQRNLWLYKAAVQMKHSLVPQADAEAAVRVLADRMPAQGGSWSIRNAEPICRSIYRHQPRGPKSPILRLVPSHVSAAVATVATRRATAIHNQSTHVKNLDVGTLRVPCAFSESVDVPECIFEKGVTLDLSSSSRSLHWPGASPRDGGPGAKGFSPSPNSGPGSASPVSVGQKAIDT